MNTKLSLTEITTMRLLNEMKTGIYNAAKRLPPEKDIALDIGVSRTVIRDSLAILEREGFINRKHGIGTIINHHVLSITNRMDLEQEFAEEVRALGYNHSAKTLYAKLIPAGARIADFLQIESHDLVYEVPKIIYADEKPVLFCADYFAKDIILREDYSDSSFEGPIFDFLEKYCGIEVFLDISEVRAVAANDKIAKYLDLPLATPVLNIEEIGYTFLGKPILVSDEYYIDGFFHHKIIRKKI